MDFAGNGVGVSAKAGGVLSRGVRVGDAALRVDPEKRHFLGVGCLDEYIECEAEVSRALAGESPANGFDRGAIVDVNGGEWKCAIHHLRNEIRRRSSLFAYYLFIHRNRQRTSDSIFWVNPKVIDNEFTVLLGQIPLVDEISSVNGCGALNRITLMLPTPRLISRFSQVAKMKQGNLGADS